MTDTSKTYPVPEAFAAQANLTPEKYRAMYAASIADPVAFWGEDAWDGAGTGYEHLHVEWTDGRQGSLYAEQTGWTKVVRK